METQFEKVDRKETLPKREPDCSTPNRNPTGLSGRNPNSVLTPSRHSPMLAPARRFSSSEWLKTIISASKPEPTSELLEAFERCQRPDVGVEIDVQVMNVTSIIFTSSHVHFLEIPESTTSSLKRIKEESVKLYYRILESMCKSETQRLQKPDLTSLLVNERFQRSLITCCSELILVANGLKSVFPDVLRLVGVCAFDFGKVIECVVRSEDTLPSELRRHLNSCEEKILESLAWMPMSTLYVSLANAKRKYVPEILKLGLQSPNVLPTELSMAPVKVSGALDESSTPAGTEEKPEASFAVSPLPSRLFASSASSSPAGKDSSVQTYIQSAFASPQRPVSSSTSETFAEVQLKVFSRKMLKLAAMRIKLLCERLQQTPSVQERIYWLVEHVVQDSSYLMFNRHLDQIVLSSVYGVSKASNGDVTFKKIITSYLELPGSVAQVFKRVFLNVTAGSEGEIDYHYCDIIRFYNEVFVPSTKIFLLKLTSSQQNSPNPSRDSPFKSLPHTSPKRVSAGHNVFVSPLRASKVDSFVSPRSMQLFACIGDSSTPFSSPTKQFEQLNSRLSSKLSGKLTAENCRKLGRLDFGDPEQQNGGAAHAPPVLEDGSPTKLVRSSEVPAKPQQKQTANSTAQRQSLRSPSPPPPAKRVRTEK